MTNRILYIEDNPLNRHLVSKMLSSAGYELCHSADGIDGLMQAAEINPGLIIVDINLPDIDGFKVIERLKRHPRLGGIPTIALTCSSDEAKCLAAGFDGYLGKPVARQELLRMIAHFLAVRASNRAVAC
ncbi:MAG: response regulator [Anaerolineae bacterium]|jgi:CheY-like chemotaxis protein|nr:response regulator [Anaerolineae bacterium]